MWWYNYKSLEHQNKLTTNLLIFNKFAFLLKMLGRLVSHFTYKPPGK